MAWSPNPPAEPPDPQRSWWKEPPIDPPKPSQSWFWIPERIGTFHAEGQMAAQVGQVYTIGADMAGAGNLSAGVSQIYSLTAQFAGAGALTADIRQTYTRQADMSGAGTMSADARVRLDRIAQLAASGTLTVQLLQQFLRPAGATATGTMAAQMSQAYALGAALTGVGTLAAQVAQKYQLSAPLAGVGTMACSAAFPAMSPATQTFSSTGSATYNIPYWCRYIDVVFISGGASGQTGNGAVNTAGKGGNSGQWQGVRLERGVDIPWTATTLTINVGAGGARPANSDNAGPTAGANTVLTYQNLAGQTVTVTATGGSGTQSGQNGGSPGNFTFQGVGYTGGNGGTGNAGAGAQPGAGGAGGNGGIFGSRTQGGLGGNGQAWCRAYQ